MAPVILVPLIPIAARLLYPVAVGVVVGAVSVGFAILRHRPEEAAVFTPAGSEAKKS